MRVRRILLLLFMGLLLLIMASCPGLYDTKRAALAARHYLDAPSEETQREIEEAKKLDKRDLVVFELAMLGIFGLSIFAFIRAGKRVYKNAAA
jgi:hypothetical protein